jgi:predicted nucleic acid-binding Zn ribbon protein
MEDRCVCCGEIIPEGRQVCAKCEYEINNKTKEVR